jgi:hypothetical protein
LKLRFPLTLTLLFLLLSAINSLAGTTAINLQEIPGWQSCTAQLNGQPCASGLGNASYATSWSQSPSMDGDATQFQIWGPTPYSNVLWWKELTPDSNAHNFTYDLWFYLTEPAKAQSLEFDVNQSIASRNQWFVFGTQCNYKDSHMWDVWDGTHEKWQPTQVPCPPVSAFTWHHLVLQFQRTDDGWVVFLSVTLDGQTSYVNYGFKTSRTASSDSVNVAFQMDGDSSEDPYSVWLDKVTLTYW